MVDRRPSADLRRLLMKNPWCYVPPDSRRRFLRRDKHSPRMRTDMKTAKEIRAEFLAHFEKLGHRIVPSSPVVPHGDPTLLFTNAGMNQFKDVFLGTGKRDFKRAADTQKCIRVSGKHNDLEEVGVDTYHHTFFEMLGNWSFGDYFKREAIKWSWDLLVNTWGLDKNRIYATVFGGDAKDGLGPDEDSEKIWPEVTGIAKDHVLRFGRKENFWEMGETGPCGPCTEIHYDRGPGTCDKQNLPSHVCATNAGCARFIELWNNVFIEFNRNEDGTLSTLPAQHVDTGMGFERITAVLQGKTSNYDTDCFTPIFRALEKMTGKTYTGSMNQVDIAFRVIADHVRTLSVAFADGALPSNEGRGYVLRRILRRAARFGRQGLDQKEPFISKLVPAVVDILGDVFPEVRARQDHIQILIDSEEKAFLVTLDRGLALYAGLAERVKKTGSKTISGEQAFDLYATFGFPRDLVELMAREDGFVVEASGWDRAALAHREASRAAGTFAHKVSQQELEGLPATKTVFYRDAEGQSGDGTSADGKIVKLIQKTALVLDKTPFYAESGGQVGDTGQISGDGFVFRVDDTQKYGDVVAHIGELTVGSPDKLPARVTATVDVARRRAVMANHTGTHLLHWALRKVLGPHATQQGSLVAPDRLRFDVTHSKAITADEIEEIERLVNARIVVNDPLRTTVEDLAAAKSRGVTALFGEKYENTVRVVDIGGYSTELCGGTHCRATGDIGAFVVVSEAAVQAGVRRIEAVTGVAAVARMQEDRRLLRELSTALKVKPQEIPTRVEALQKEIKDLKKSGDKAMAQDVASTAKELLAAAKSVGGARVIVARVDLPGGELAGVADILRNGHDAVCGFLASTANDKVTLVAFASKDLLGRGVHAGNVAKAAAPIVGGGGGGRPEFAQAGGKDAAKVDDALEVARQALAKALGA